MTYQTFTRDRAAGTGTGRAAIVGWRQISRARPNAGHRAVGDAAARGRWSAASSPRTSTDCTRPAGARDVVELHGGLDRTICLACGDVATRGRARRAAARGQPDVRRRGSTRSTPTATPSCPTRTSTASSWSAAWPAGAAQARCRVLRRDGAARPGRALLRAG